MNSIISGIQKLIEHYILSFVNTGDRILDNTINVVIVSLIGCFFTFDYKALFRRNVKNVEGVENVENFKFPSDTAEINKNFDKYDYNRKYTWFSGEYPEFTEFVKGEYTQIYASSLLHVDIHTTKVMNNMNKVNVTNSRVIYQCVDGTFIFICPDESGGFYLRCKSFKAFEEFRNYISIKYKCPLKPVEPDRSIIDHDKHVMGSIFKDRTFDTIVSKHKKSILRYLDEFMKPNKNVFDLHNLGIIFHGPPGTGKTSIIKAIANYVRKDICIVDLKKIETIERLMNTLEHDNRIFVFEELDLVPGVLTRGSQERKDAEEKEHQIKEKESNILYARYNDLLRKVNNDTPEIVKELEKIKKQLDSLKQKFTLDTLLALLDGPIEKRGRLIIATTNRIDDLDPALKRPNRFDMIIHLDKYNSDEIREYLKVFYSYKSIPKEDVDYIDNHDYQDGVFTPADVSNMCKYYSCARDTVDKLKV